MLTICCAAVLQSFDTTSGKIVLDAPWHLILADEDWSIQGTHIFGCKDNFCWYGFYTSDSPNILFKVAFTKIGNDNRSFEKMVEQEYAVYDLSEEAWQKEADSNFTLAFAPLGEWTTTNEGKKMYFEANPNENGASIHKPYAVIDFSGTNLIADIEAAHVDSDAILAIGKSFKFTAKAAEQPKTQPGFEILLAVVGLFAARYMRRKE